MYRHDIMGRAKYVVMYLSEYGLLLSWARQLAWIRSASPIICIAMEGCVAVMQADTSADNRELQSSQPLPRASISVREHV